MNNRSGTICVCPFARQLFPQLPTPMDPVRATTNFCWAFSNAFIQSLKDKISICERPFPYTRSKTRWRKRPQDEIKYLRAHTAELENLKNALSNPNTKPNLLEEIGRDRNIPRDDCCNRKLDAALVENRQLRAMVAGRYQVAKALQDAIDRHARMKAREVYCPTNAAALNELIFALLDEATDLYCKCTAEVAFVPLQFVAQDTIYRAKVIVISARIGFQFYDCYYQCGP
ncbi:unnamed protein product [Peronospora destructor]|uniref:Uncharacterized protein n=1 Tax=Peronospora destructor TaxID=86335 RepID=A0AAV0T659_9STRA|nr:unnamed protein product [Peronospora destructor]